MTRPFELSNRTADGGSSRPALATRERNTNPHVENIIPLSSGRTFLPDSRAKERELSLDHRELVTGAFFFVSLILCPAFIVFAVYFLYQALVSQPV
jgi:hypothetical protein